RVLRGGGDHGPSRQRNSPRISRQVARLPSVGVDVGASAQRKSSSRSSGRLRGQAATELERPSSVLRGGECNRWTSVAMSQSVQSLPSPSLFAFLSIAISFIFPFSISFYFCIAFCCSSPCFV